MQPAFLPWLGYFELIDKTDAFVILDSAQFQRQYRGHRNTLFTSKNTPNYVTLPIQHQNNLKSRFIDIKENYLK